MIRAAAPAPGEALPGFGPYQALRLIGRGASSVVYAAAHRGSGAAVALKVLSAQAEGDGGDDAHRRFLDQARIGARLAHPDIAAVHEAGRQRGCAWLAMELLPGCELTRYTRAPRLLPDALVLQIGERLARALAHAHARGVVHRDLKPANVMLDLPAGTLKLTDFGIAGLADASRTRTGVVLGTPLYMAPEQLAGAPADARSDLYALGVLLYELLGGRRPHEHASLGELLRQVAQQPAPDLRTLRPGLDDAAAELVARCLHKQPSSRPADAAALADALQVLRRRGSGGGAGPMQNPALPDGCAAPPKPCR
ncbi:MAG TPA: serine/threonine-protein kinase [Rubrivivax sp.]|nr:serine/threonine-protein kinase [Rubrivivax sp.]HRY87953.1 serine/threonine-protein kinase [Rubrivivax sp.]HRZ61389.1 serine/threonine-protein kinase [Rubrivivax sp.]